MVTPLALSTAATIIIGVAAIVGFALLAVVLPWLNLYMQARFAGAPIGLAELTRLRSNKVDPRTIVFSRIRAVRAGIDLSVDQLLAHHLAGGRVASVVNALIAADRGNIDLDWETACEMDLAGHDIQQAAIDLVNQNADAAPGNTA